MTDDKLAADEFALLRTRKSERAHFIVWVEVDVDAVPSATVAVELLLLRLKIRLSLATLRNVLVDASDNCSVYRGWESKCPTKEGDSEVFTVNEGIAVEKGDGVIVEAEQA